MLLIIAHAAHNLMRSDNRSRKLTRKLLISQQLRLTQIRHHVARYLSTLGITGSNKHDVTRKGWTEGTKCLMNNDFVFPLIHQ